MCVDPCCGCDRLRKVILGYVIRCVIMTDIGSMEIALLQVKQSLKVTRKATSSPDGFLITEIRSNILSSPFTSAHGRVSLVDQGGVSFPSSGFHMATVVSPILDVLSILKSIYFLLFSCPIRIFLRLTHV